MLQQQPGLTPPPPCARAGAPTEAQFADFGYQPYTDAEATFLAGHYAGLSVEKCSGPNNTEEVVWANSKLVKSKNPATKMVFYWAVDQGALGCYGDAVTRPYLSNPSLWLKDDAGAHIYPSPNAAPVMDYCSPAARAWWTGVPLGGAGSPQAPWVDGVLADGIGYGVAGANCFRPSQRISPDRCNALIACKGQMMREMQALLNNTNGGVVLGNGLVWYPFPNGDPTHNAFTLGDQRGIFNEHTAVFESVLADGSLNTSLTATMIDTLNGAAAMGKVVVVALWPGPLVGFGAGGEPVWPNNAQPKTIADWKPVMLRKAAFAEAFYLTVASPRTFMQYMLWYNGFQQGVLPCDDAPASCVAPNSATWYPDFVKPLGPPLGPAVRTGNVWVRHFARATSTLDLDNPDASSVVFT